MTPMEASPRPVPRPLALLACALVVATIGIAARHTALLAIPLELTALTLYGAPWIVVGLDRPLLAMGMYGLRREVRTLGIGADEPDLLASALAAPIPTNREDERR